MEKNKNISLDELFARAKGEEPIIGKEDVRAIIEESPVQSLQQTTSFISRKGFIMTGLGLVGAAAALVGYLTLGSSNTVPSKPIAETPRVIQGAKAETTTPTVEPKKDSKEPKGVKQEKVIIVKMGHGEGAMKIKVEDDGTPAPKFDGPHTPDGKLMAPIAVEKVAIVQAKESDLPKLGLTRASNGDILFKASETGGRGMTIAIPANGWGVKTNIVSGKDAETDVKLSPMIITDERGNRRYVNFSDSNTWVHMQRFNGDIPGGVIIDGNNVPNIHINNDEVNLMVNNDKKVDGKEIKSRYNARKKIVIAHDSTSSDSDADIHKMKMNVAVNHGNGEANKFNLNFNFGDSTKDMKIILEEAMKKVKVALKGLKVNVDSIDEALININVDNEFNWKGNLPGFDTMMKDFNKGMKQFQIQMNGFDSSMKNFGANMGSLMVIDQNFSPEEAEAFDNNVGGGLRNLNKELESVEKRLSAKLNTLVPVLIRKGTVVTRNEVENRDYDNGVIMWFEPEYYWKQVADPNSTYEVVFGKDVKLVNGTSHLATIAQDKQSDASKQVVSNATVYPNPVRSTMGKTNVQYTLSQPRTVAFSIHDILGKKVVDCGSLAERPAGTYNFELNVANVPAGIYLVVITTDKGEQSIQRIVIE